MTAQKRALLEIIRISVLRELAQHADYGRTAFEAEGEPERPALSRRSERRTMTRDTADRATREEARARTAGGILARRRRGWDSNPRYRDYRYNGFRDRPIQPLSHPSGCDIAG